MKGQNAESFNSTDKTQKHELARTVQLDTVIQSE